MEYRKLISFGKSSFIVSLPKSWITQNKMKKGDLVYMEDSGGGLILQPNASKSKEQDKEITINIEGKNPRRIQREIISSYIKNYKTITLVGNDIKNKAKTLQQFIHNLVALEIMEQDAKKIVAKDFLNLDDISIEQIIKKMDIITRSMMSDCRNMFKEDTYENINHRDDDVNRFRFLIFRIVWFGMENPSLSLKKFKLNQLNMLHLWWLAFTIEAIADHTKRIARYLRETKLNPKNQQEFLQLLTTVEQSYVEMMKGYYTKNPELAHEVLEKREYITGRCDEFYLKNKEAPYIGYLTQNLKSLIVNIHTIGRMIYQEMT